MKYRSGFLILFGLGCMGLVASPAEAWKENYVGYFDCSTKVVNANPATGQVTVAVTLTPLSGYDRRCEAVSFEITDIEDVEILSPLRWDLPLIDSITPLVAMIDLRVPTHDTAGFALVTTCGTWNYKWPQFFGPAGDSIRWFWSDPRTWPPLGAPAPDSVRARLAQERSERYLEWLRQQPPPPPPLGYSSTYIIIYPGDSALADSLTEQGKSQLAGMRKREQSPLVDADCEPWSVDDRHFIRHRGESRFRPVETFTLDQARERAQRKRDSLEVAQAHITYEVLVDLRNPADSLWVAAHVDSLIPTDSTGFYRIKINKRTWRQMGEAGVPWWETSTRKPPVPRSHPEPPKPPRSERDATLPLHLADGRSLLFFEGFEGAWPGAC